MEEQHVKNNLEQEQFSLIPTGIGTLIALLLLICLVAILSLWQPWQPVEVVKENTLHRTTIDNQQNQSMHYEFYDELVKQKVLPVPEKPIEHQSQTIEPIKSHAIIESEGKIYQPYMLVVHHFEDADQADAEQAKLQIAGFTSDIMIEANKNGEITYHVIVGPFDNKQQAEIVKNNLKRRGIHSELSAISHYQTDQK